MITLVRLMLRRHRWLLSAWSGLLIALTGVTVSAYQSTYSSAEQRRTATELAQHNAATTLLYGALGDPGTPAQMFTWEIGAITTLLVAVMAVLVAVSLTRAGEDDGTLELVRCSGIDPRLPLRSALVVLAIVAAVLTLGCSAALGLAVGHVDAVTASGTVVYGAVVGLTFLLVAVLAVVLAQVAPSAAGARVLGFAALAAAFAIRAAADTQHLQWLNWLSPLGLRATVRPFVDNRWWVLAVYLVAAVALGALAGTLSDRREYGGGLVRRRDRRPTRLNIRSTLALTGRLAGSPVLAWTVAVAGIGTLFSAMGSGVIQQSQDEDLGGFLGSQLGTGDPIPAFFSFSGTVVGLMVATFAVLSVARAGRDEADGHTDQVLATGVRRWVPLGAQVAVTAVGAAVVLVVTGALSALVVPQVITGADVAVRAFGYTVGQWPAAMAAAGWAALLTGLRPRLAWLAWLPVVAGGVLALLGDLLGVPDRLRDLGIFQHVPDVAGPDPGVRGLLVLLVLAVAGALVGLLGTTRRDIVAG